MKHINNNPRICVRNQTRNTTVAQCAELADTSASRKKGLLGRDALNAGEGLWIVPCESVHTFGMRFSIDVVYLGRNKCVRKIRRELVPCRISMCLPAHSVLELPAGTIDKTATQCGDQLEFVRIE